jgi:hypothetical protein
MPKVKKENEVSTSMLKATIVFLAKNALVGLWAILALFLYDSMVGDGWLFVSTVKEDLIFIFLLGCGLFLLVVFHVKWYKRQYHSNFKKPELVKLCIGIIGIIVNIFSLVMFYKLVSFVYWL